MSKTNGNAVQGLVIESLPNTMFRLQLENGETVIAFLSGRMRVNKIKVMLGDKVTVELDPYKGKATNRIIRRL
jgi:translation initiation factor IF-1